MSKLISWFETVPNQEEARKIFWRVFKLDMSITFVVLVLSFYASDIPQLINEINEAIRDKSPVQPPNTDTPLSVHDMVVQYAVFAVLMILFVGVVAPVVEEALFRLLPIGCAILVFRWSRWTKPLILVTAVAAGIAFGLIHLANKGATITSVLLLQGTGGILYGLLFAKVSGLAPSGLWRAYKTTVKMHMLFNLVALPIVVTMYGLVVAATILPRIDVTSLR